MSNKIPGSVGRGAVQSSGLPTFRRTHPSLCCDSCGYCAYALAQGSSRSDLYPPVNTSTRTLTGLPLACLAEDGNSTLLRNVDQFLPYDMASYHRQRWTTKCLHEVHFPIWRACGSVVVEAVGYKLEGRGYETRRGE
jgi:hypothetical protein